MLGDQAGQRCLSATRRPPEDDGGKFILFNRLAERPARPHDVILSDEIIEPAGPHSFCQRNLSDASRQFGRRK